ncbi:MAG: hypothetical protein IJX58_02045, partial [Clostridia bacterium]|nr:hypothetical protein [Clostridia bacterium]
GAFFVSVVEHQSDSNLVRALCFVLQILAIIFAHEKVRIPNEAVGKLAFQQRVQVYCSKGAKSLMLHRDL